MESNKPIDDPGSLAAAAASFPLLVYDHGERPDNSQIVLSVADGSLHTYQLPEMRNFRCLETPQGPVLMVDAASLQCSLWNPLTGEKMPLPAMDEAPSEYCRCLVADTDSSRPEWNPDSLVLVYDLSRPELLMCRIRGRATAAWVRQSYDMGLYEVPGKPITERAIHYMAAVQGVFYYLESTPNTIGSLFSFADDPELGLELVTFNAKLPELDWKDGVTLRATKTYLLEHSKDLFLFCLFYKVVDSTLELEEFGAYMMDLTKKEWIEVDDIGDAAFLLGPGGFAASCPATEHGLKKGCVYHACDDLGDSNDYEIFDLKEGTREVAGPNQDIPVLSRKPFWLVPVHPDVNMNV
ncbi:unnamed protein product [Urochloa decumbens]|uniref:KIB1-4 beta-propeller domain-containing protein n=1 Tax=Urochloa decumbens TaxID=240449 RepID=A0ABC8ZQD5_9POAL